MTPDQITRVQDSFKKVAPIADAAADLFYDRLFEIAPEYRPLFPENMRDQKKKLMAMLGTVVTNLHRTEVILPAAKKLGRDHAGYGVTAAHYAPVGAALLWTLGKGLGDAFTPEVEEAWAAAYSLLSGVMIEASAQASAA